MKDIFDIKGIVINNPFDIQIFVLSLLLALLLSLILGVIYKVVMEFNFYKKRQNAINKIKLEFKAKLVNLDKNNDNFFYELNFLIKHFLDEFNIFPNITRMTKKEILSKNITIKKLSEIIIICEKFEFSKEKNATEEAKMSLINNAINIIESNHL